MILSMIKSKFTFFEMRMKSAKGQIAIFVVLIFQAIFILFAMTINISLAVYDKINFQNSLDLAAYYGAKQQAEVLNAMAHINYQMRQNWKLLSWRYRILGTLLQDQGVPSTTPKFWCPQSREFAPPANQKYCNIQDCVGDTNCQNSCLNAQARLPYPQGYCDHLYFICISHDIWKRGIGPSNQNLCQTFGVEIPAITGLSPSPSIYIFPEYRAAIQATLTLQSEVETSCPKEGALNGLMTQFFLTHFRLDQKDRKQMMRAIYKKSLKDGKDLDGKSIFGGAKKVFYNNLSQANKSSVDVLPHYGLKSFNSFEGKEFDGFFGEFEVRPVLQFLTNKDDGSNSRTKCDAKIIQHHDLLDQQSQTPIIDSFIDRLSNHPLKSPLRRHKPRLFGWFKINTTGFFYRGNDPFRKLILGFFKKPKKILYYGLKGEFTYKSRVFALNSPGVKFKASAFAKAFGGRFGPQPKQHDHLIPLVDPPPGTPAKIKIPNNHNPTLLHPNYSRWPGDRLGLIDKVMHENAPHNAHNFLNKHHTGEVREIQKIYTMEAFFHLIFASREDKDDPLARPPTGNRPMHNTFMRMMELMAVYPDVYDLSYYSISGNYTQTYFQRICKLLSGSKCEGGRNKIRNPENSSNPPPYIRGDFGWPESTGYMIKRNMAKKNVELSIAPYFLKGGGPKSIDITESSDPEKITLPPPPPPPDSPQTPPHIARPGPPNHPRIALTQGRFFYDWLAQDLPAHLLSSWTPRRPKDYDNYTLDENVFLKCDGKALEKMPSASACVMGGRSGYSVKLISCETAQSFENKPPAEYCP